MLELKSNDEGSNHEDHREESSVGLGWDHYFYFFSILVSYVEQTSIDDCSTYAGMECQHVNINTQQKNATVKVC